MRKGRNRIALLVMVALLASSMLFAAGQIETKEAVDEPVQVIFRLDWLPSAYHAPVFVAVENGYWEDAGLDVEVQFGKGSTDTAKMVATKQADFGWANTVVTTHAIETGMPLKTIYGTYQKNALGVMVFKDSGITDASQLGGKKVTMTGSGEEAVLFPLWMEFNGVDSENVDRVIIESRDTRRAMFLEGEVDAYWETLFSNIPVLQEQTDREITGIMISDGDHPLNLLLQGLITNTTMIEDSPEVVEAFVAGFKKAIQWSMDDPEGATDILMKLVPEIQNREISIGILENSFKLFQTNNSESMALGMYSDKDWDVTLDLMVEMGNLETIDSYDKYYTNEFIPED